MRTLKEFINEEKRDSQFYVELDIDNTDVLYQKAMKAKTPADLQKAMSNLKDKFPDKKYIKWDEVKWNEVFDSLNESANESKKAFNKTMKDINKSIEDAIKNGDKKYLDTITKELDKILKGLDK